MISYNLTCAFGHVFEGWFGSSADYDDQQARGLVACPVCDNTVITKALMTPNVTAKSNQKSGPAPMNNPSAHHPTRLTSAEVPPQERSVMPSSPPMAPTVTAEMVVTPEMMEAAAKVMAEMRKVQSTIERQCDDVGDSFAEEARKIHYGESEARGIYGRTTEAEAEDLLDEGIAITKMPWLPKEQ
ncbi:MAG: DUF1178 family protein [Alphaproteobacteria bacterium]|nr:DUF1178 family protein [Alphaproteobacteria bacterium]